MQCPSCGYENVSGAERCAICGRPLIQTAGQGYGGPTPQPGGEPPSMPPSGPLQQPMPTPQQPISTPGAPYGATPGQPDAPPPQPAPPSTPLWAGPTTPGAPPPQPSYGTPAPPSGYGMPPAAGYGAPTAPQPGYGPQTTPPGYGTPAPPSGYGAPTPQPGAPYGGYGQPAPPSYPMQPGQPGWQYPPGYGPGGQPPQPPRRSRTGWIVGGIIAAVLVLVVCSVGTLLLVSANNLSTTSDVTATATTGQTPTPTRTTLYQNTFASDAIGWPNNSNCFESSGGYHVKGDSSSGIYCVAPDSVGQQSDVDVTVTASQLTGNSDHGYGFLIRASSNGDYYEMEAFSDSTWAFAKCLSTTTKCDLLAGNKKSSSLQSGLNAPNTLRVVAKGSHFDVYANDTKLGQADDSSLTSGKIGLFCGRSTECAYTNFSVAQPS
jgi:hypothetical protein